MEISQRTKLTLALTAARRAEGDWGVAAGAAEAGAALMLSSAAAPPPWERLRLRALPPHPSTGLIPPGATGIDLTTPPPSHLWYAPLICIFDMHLLDGCHRVQCFMLAMCQVTTLTFHHKLRLSARYTHRHPCVEH